MSVLEKIQEHAPRVRHSLGQRLTVGSREYRRRGYHADRLATETSEAFMLPVLREVLSRPGAFIDVGANVGQTLMKLLTVDPSRQYVGFEPQTDCCFYLQRFIADNSLSNCSIVPVALSDSNGLFPLYSDKPNDDMASLLPSHTQKGERSNVSWCQARIGDEALSELGIEQIAAIKIDVEGLELEVIKGLSNTLKSKPPILFEVLDNYAWKKLVDPKTRRANTAKADAIFSLLTEAGYRIGRINGRGIAHPIDRFRLDSEAPVGFGEGRDYLAQ